MAPVCPQTKQPVSAEPSRALHQAVPVPTPLPTRRPPQGIQWLMADQQPGDSLFFHFSGHGSQQYDRNGDEEVGGAAKRKPGTS